MTRKEKTEQFAINGIIFYICIFVLALLFTSCTEEEIAPPPCIGDCETQFEVIYKNQFIYPNSDGYFEVEWDDLNYFQVEGTLTPLNQEYVLNGVPLITSKFDSDYWIVMDTLQFQTPMYSYLGWFNDNDLNTPINIGSYTYTINDLINSHPPLNIAGYQIPKYFCTECAYAETILGSHSNYNYRPKQNFMLDNEMAGDTINIFIETTFNFETSQREVILDHLKVIVL